MKERSIIATALIASALVATVWAFPLLWYTKVGPEKPMWLIERTNVVGWNYTPVPVSKTEEVSLHADKTVAGEFAQGHNIVRVFSAKRFSNDPNEIGLFGHTPDRCWTEAGWRIQIAAPEVVDVDVHGVTLHFERRVFAWKTGEKLLVYFTGLNAGQPLPYRLNHHLSIAQKVAFAGKRSRSFFERNSDPEYLKYVWTVFSSRRQIVGPKHFIRIATEIAGDSDDSADKRLRAFLPAWLEEGDLKIDATDVETKKTSEAGKSSKTLVIHP